MEKEKTEIERKRKHCCDKQAARSAKNYTHILHVTISRGNINRIRGNLSWTNVKWIQAMHAEYSITQRKNEMTQGVRERKQQQQIVCFFFRLTDFFSAMFLSASNSLLHAFLFSFIYIVEFHSPHWRTATNNRFPTHTHV